MRIIMYVPYPSNQIMIFTELRMLRIQMMHLTYMQFIVAHNPITSQFANITQMIIVSMAIIALAAL